MSPNQIPPPPAVSRHRLRWLVPSAVAFSMLVGFGFGPALIGTGASADPILPTISAQDLVAKVVAGTAPAFSGTVQTHTNLGLPSLGSLGQNGTGLLSTILSPHTIKVSARPQDGMFHVAIPDALSETDVVSDGSQVWVWQSSNQTVTHLAKQADAADPSADEPAGPDDGVEPTPDAIAKELLANADPSTRVFVRGTASVAGRDAYELVLAPTSTTTLVADVVIDVDAATGLPLRAQVLAKDSGTPALDIGFTSISFAAQPDSAFTFTAPPGAKVVEATSPEELLFGAGGQDDGPRRRPGDQKGAVVAPSSSSAGAVTPASGAPEARTRVLGSGWDAVAAIPNGAGTFADVGRPVSGAWGSGKLITSTLADALVLDDGTVLVGMVGADRLEAAVAELRTGS
jgi:outer membrane lipoprotein-sorting protein